MSIKGSDIVSPYLKNEPYEYSIPSRLSIDIHMMPASAPIGDKMAPKLLPIIVA